MDLTAKRRFKYRGRWLEPGQEFSAGRSQGRLLRAIGRAAECGTYQTPDLEPVKVAKRPRPARQPVRANEFDHDGSGGSGGSPRLEQTPGLLAARAEYTRVVGKRFFSGWTEDQLRERIAQHQGGTGG